jgi:hypothetical protein
MVLNTRTFIYFGIGLVIVTAGDDRTHLAPGVIRVPGTRSDPSGLGTP